MFALNSMEKKCMNKTFHDEVIMDKALENINELLEMAARGLSDNSDAEQVVLVKTSTDRTYLCYNNSFCDGVGDGESGLLNDLSANNDVEVNFIAALWNPMSVNCDQDNYAVDLPSYNLRRGLLKLSQSNENSIILLRGENGFIDKKLSATMPTLK